MTLTQEATRQQTVSGICLMIRLEDVRANISPAAPKQNTGQLVNGVPKGCSTPVMFAQVTELCLTGKLNHALRWIIAMSFYFLQRSCDRLTAMLIVLSGESYQKRRHQITSPGDPGAPLATTGPEQRLQRAASKELLGGFPALCAQQYRFALYERCR